MNEFIDVNNRFKGLMHRARVNLSEKAVTECLIAAEGYSAALTPIATSFLLNSRYRFVEITVDGVHGEIGYGANYAEYVHDAPGTLLGSGEYRNPETDGLFWGPGGKPGFLTEGVMEMARGDMANIMRENFLI